MDLNDYKVEIRYPCAWTYTVIGADRRAMEQVVADVVGEIDYTLTISHVSSTGKYCSLQLELIVETETHRTDIFHALRRHPAIKAVM
ncbi:MAG: DUF493 domain-containing protein [Thermoguttaceae bacterium]|jgi:putative lipoic acid-binding regulatory protein